MLPKSSGLGASASLRAASAARISADGPESAVATSGAKPLILAPLTATHEFSGGLFVRVAWLGPAPRYHDDLIV